MSYWMENAMKRGKHNLLDLGYVNSQTARDRADLIFKIISKANLEIAGFSRLLIRIPKAKLEKVLAAHPAIKLATEQPGYSWCTHTWIDTETTDMKYCR